MKLSNIKAKNDKGVAGLSIILSIVVFLFIIGFLTMIFALMGDELAGAVGSGTTAQGLINNTTTALAGVVDWFDIVIVIGFMVVLILLMVLIISTIKGGGLLSGGGVA